MSDKEKGVIETQALEGGAAEDAESLIEFPCRYQIKAMGRDSEEFHSAVCAIVDEHAPGTPDEAYSHQKSSKGKFVSVSVEVDVDSREHLEKIYGALKDSSHVLYLL
ncbi:MAG: HP0495 family protein [bacterium]